MDLKIIAKELTIDLYGFSGTAVNKEYAKTAFSLADRMWKIVKSNDLKNKGLNVWVYEPNEKMFAGVELTAAPSPDVGLERETVRLPKYAYYKHVGPFTLVGQVGQHMGDELRKKGYETILPYVEIYGHMTDDETKLETELLMSLK